MVAGLGLVTHPRIDTRPLQIRRKLEVEQQMIDPQPGIAGPVVTEIVPEGVDTLVRVQMAYGIEPALIKQSLVTRSRLRLQQCVLQPGTRVIDVHVGGHDIEIPCQQRGVATSIEAARMLDQAFEPVQLVIELGPGLRVAVRQVEASDQHPVCRSFQIAALAVLFQAGQAAANLERIAAPHQNGHAVP
ncbi:hypothetical protein D9M73_196890 [compost metagenome]